MITIISNKKEIEKHRTEFLSKIDQYFTEKIKSGVSYPGGQNDGPVNYSPDLNLWIFVKKLKNRIWHGFGSGKPIEGKYAWVIAEINFPLNGIKRRIAGVFAVDKIGNILVLHRGIVRAVNKNFFMDKFSGDKVYAIDGERENEFCLVGELNSPFFPKQVAYFISEINRIKSLKKTGEPKNFNELNNFRYTAESSGKSTVDRKGKTVINRIHGIVVDALAKLIDAKGYKISNDRNRDLFIHNKGKITVLFEIKTSSSTQCLYEAVGQLIIYSIPFRNKVDLIMVLPDKLNKAVESHLERLGINCLYYKWENKNPVFINLTHFVK